MPTKTSVCQILGLSTVASSGGIVVPAAIALAAAILSLLAIKFVPSPYVWVCALWAALGFTAAARLARLYQDVALVFASVAMALGAGELVAAFLVQPEAKMTIEFTGVDSKSAPNSYTVPDDELGWRNLREMTAHVTKSIGGNTIYAVHYTFDGAGQRIVPPVREHNAQGCVLFFTDSFTFGEGVNDEQAYPYRVGVHTRGRFRIYNFGVGGYGPHHMLAQLEQDAFVGALDCRPSHIFYLALPHHVPRVANKAAQGGPRYELGEDGQLHREPPAQVGEGLLAKLLARSNSYLLLEQKYLGRGTSYFGRATDADLKRYFLVVSIAGERAAQRWPGVELHILAWNLHPWFAQSFERFCAGLMATGWRLHDVDSILPGYQKDLRSYSLSPFDLHPNALAYDFLAAYIADKILPPAPAASR